MIFIYSGLFSAEKDNHPIPSFYEMITGEPAASSGLSRSFSEIVRGDFNSASNFNPNGIPVFIFFLTQFFQRVALSVILKKKLVKVNMLVIVDTIVSAAFFLFCFSGLIKDYIDNFIRLFEKWFLQ